MTGTELSAALAEKLKVLLPDCAVRPAFTGTLQRLPQRAAVTVGVMQEENADGVFETVLGVQLYAQAALLPLAGVEAVSVWREGERFIFGLRTMLGTGEIAVKGAKV